MSEELSPLMSEIIAMQHETNIPLPNVWQALGQANASLGDVYRLMLSEGDWLRSHPQQFNPQLFGAQLGNVLMMLMLAGYQYGVDPINELRKQLMSD